MRLKLLILVLLISPLLIQAKYGSTELNVSPYYGYSYRSGNGLFKSFELLFEKYFSTCTRRKFSAYGLRFDDLGGNNYALSIKYMRPLTLNEATVFIPYVALSPGIYKLQNNNQLFIKPELGFRLSTPKFCRNQLINVCLIASYGYDIRLTRGDLYTPRHSDISVRLGLAINTYWFYHKAYLKKQRKLAEQKSEGS